MSRVLTRCRYFGRTALRGMRASPVTSGVAVATIGVSLVLVGAFALLLQNMDDLLENFGDELHVTAFVDDGVEGDALAALAARAEQLPGVERVRTVSKEEALARFERGVGRGAALLEGLGENPLPASLEVVLAVDRRSGEGLAAVRSELATLPGVSDLSSGTDWVEGYLRAVALVRGVGWGLGGVVALAALLIVANTIRLAVYARRDELEILSLVGASRSFVTTPFLLEGLLQGALGGAAALAILYAVFRVVLPGFEFGLELVLGAAPRFFDPVEAAVLVAVGGALGLTGSAAAVAGGWRV